MTCYVSKISIVIPFTYFILLTLFTLLNWKERIIPWLIILVLISSLALNWAIGFRKEIYNKEFISEFKIEAVKPNYLIVSSGIRKYYISTFELDNHFILNQTIKIKGIYLHLDDNYKFYQFNFKEYLNKIGVYSQIEAHDIQLSNDGFLYWLNNLYAKSFGNDLEKIFILNNHNSDIDLIKNMNNLSLGYLLNFSGLNVFFISFLIHKNLALFKLKYKQINLIKLNIDLLILVFCFTINFPFVLTKTVLFLFIKNLLQTKNIKINRVKLWLICFCLLTSLNNQIMFQGSFYYYLVILIFFNQPKHKSMKYKIGYNLFLATITFVVMNMMSEYRFLYLNSVFDLIFAPIVAFENVFVLLTFWIPKIDIVYEYISKITILEFEYLNKINFYYAVGYVNKIIYVIYFVFLFLSFKTIGKKKYIWISFTAIIIAFILLSKFINNNELFTLFDVGNGQTLLFKSKKETILFDCGVGSGHSNNMISDYLKYFGIIKIDKIFISHFHDDHFNQLDSLKDNNFKIKEVITYNNSLEFYKTKELEINIFNLNNNDINENNNSLVYLVTFKDKNILIMSDLEKDREINLVKDERFVDLISYKNIDYMILGHHGSKTSSSKELLELIKPKLVLISGEVKGNRHFPDIETLTTLNELNINYLITSKIGDINF